MSCEKCKNKKSILEEREEMVSGFNKGVIWFVVIWSLLAFYGLYSLIQLFI